MQNKFPAVSTASLIAALAALGVKPGPGGGGGGLIPVGTNGIGVFDYNQAAGIPASGEVTFNNASPSAATEMHISRTTSDGQDATQFLDALIGVDSIIYFQSNQSPQQFVNIISDTVVVTPLFVTVGFSQVIESSTPLADGADCGLSVAQTYLTPDAAVGLINNSLSNSLWQQGISGAVFVRDFSASSEVLAPFLNNVSGEWDFPDQTLLAIDTQAQSLPSVLGRDINALGSLSIQPTISGGVKGISLGAAVPGASSGIKMDSGGSLTIGDVVLASDDVSRPFFDLTDCGSFVYRGSAIFVLNGGEMNCGSITIDGALVGGLASSFIVGEQNQLIQISGDARFPVGLLGSTVDVFDLTSSPIGGFRGIDVKSTIGNTNTAGTALFAIDQDNGENQSVFSNCIQDFNGLGVWMRAVNDVAFNAAPQKSVFQNFDVVRFIVTQRQAEVGILNDGSVIDIPQSGQYVDMVNPTFILDQDSTSGFEMDATNGAIINKLQTPSTYKFDFLISGIKVGQGANDYAFSPSFKPAAGVYSQIEVDDGVNQAVIENRNEFTPNDPSFVSLSFTKRFENVDDEVKVQIQNVQDGDDFQPVSVQFIATRIGS